MCDSFENQTQRWAESLALPALLIGMALAQDGNGLLLHSTTLPFVLYQSVFPLPAPWLK